MKIDLPLPVGIPEDYIQDRSVRLALYRRAANIIKSSEINDLKAEFKDRFGSLPETVDNLLLQLELKLLAEKAGLESIFTQYGKITLGYPEDDFPANDVNSEREPLNVNTKWIGLE